MVGLVLDERQQPFCVPLLRLGADPLLDAKVRRPPRARPRPSSGPPRLRPSHRRPTRRPRQTRRRPRSAPPPQTAAHRAPRPARPTPRRRGARGTSPSRGSRFAAKLRGDGDANMLTCADVPPPLGDIGNRYYYYYGKRLLLLLPVLLLIGNTRYTSRAPRGSVSLMFHPSPRRLPRR